MKKEKANPKPVWTGGTDLFTPLHVTADFCLYIQEQDERHSGH